MMFNGLIFEDFLLSNTGSIRLVDGYDNTEGRVEIYHDGKWGTVCDRSWDINDAQVVCQSLGLGAATAAKSSAYFGEGSGDIWLSDVNCTGTESNLLECDYRGWGVDRGGITADGSNCKHKEDASVVCSRGKIIKRLGDIYIANNSRPFQHFCLDLAACEENTDCPNAYCRSNGFCGKFCSNFLY